MSEHRRLRFADLGFAMLLGVGLLIVFGALDFYGKQLQRQALQTEEHLTSRDLRHADEQLGHLFRHVDLQLRTLLEGGHAYFSPDDWSRQLDYALLNAPHLRSLSVLNDNGEIIASTSSGNIGLRPAFAHYLPQPSTISEVLRIGPPHAGRDLADSVAITDNRQPTPAVGFVPVVRGLSIGEAGQVSLLATLNLDYLQRLLDDLRRRPTDRIALFRQDGVRLLDTDPPTEHRRMIERTLINHWQTGQSVHLSIADAYDDQGDLTAYRMHSRLPLVITMQMDRTQALVEAHREGRERTAVVAPLALLGMAAALVGYLLFRFAGNRERKLRKQEEKRRKLLESALNASAIPAVITNREATIEWVNPAFASLTGFDAAEAIGRKPKDLVKSGMQPPSYYEDMWKTILAGAVWRGEVINRRKDGSFYDEALTITPVADDNGTITHFVAIKEDITLEKAAARELERLATTDPLTGSHNRRAFMEAVQHELDRVRRYETPASILMLDLDHFKRVNDEFGHAAGDTVLKHFVTQLGTSLRSADTLGRIGGEEFAVLLPETDLAGARDIANRIRTEIAARPAITDEARIPITVSIGVTIIHPSDISPDHILARADDGLYLAKRNGRNRVETVTREAPPTGE